MKTAEEWNKELHPSQTYKDCVCSLDDIRAIQLDAIKEGMTLAANIARREANIKGRSDGMRTGCLHVDATILQEIDNLKELPQ